MEATAKTAMTGVAGVRSNQKVHSFVRSPLRFVRIIGFFFFQLIWPILRRMRWLTVFVVNAGRVSDVRAYCPAWAEGFFRKHRPVSPGGWIYTPGHLLSLIVVSPFSNDEILKRPDLCRRITTALKKLKTRRIALNGVIPSALEKYKIWGELDGRFVKDQRGTVFMLTENVRQIVARHGWFAQQPIIAVVGAGYTGAEVIRGLVEQNYQVAALDKRLEQSEGLPASVQFWGKDFSRLANAGIVVLLTNKGNDGLDTIAPHLRRGTVVLSDTHPKVSPEKWRALREQGVIGYDCASERPGSRFFPPLPRFNSDSLPGCVVSAFVQAICDKTAGCQTEFNAMAKQIGLQGRLDVPG